MEILTKCFTENSIHLYPIGDIHIGDKCFGRESRRKLQGYINWIRATPNAYAVLMGDLVNVATLTSPSSPFDQNMTLDDQIKTVVGYFEPIKHKILGAIEGNHEQRLGRYVGYSPTISICERLGIKYLNDSAVIIFRLGCRPKQFKSNPSSRGCRGSFVGYFHHSVGGGATIGGKMNRVEKLTSLVADCDFYCVAANTMIKTIDGYFPIKDIRIGDMVLTKEGTYKKVSKVFSRKADTISIKTRGGFQDLIATPEHPVFVQKNERKINKDGTKYIPTGEPTWTLTKDVKEGDWLAIAKEEKINTLSPKIMGQELDKELAYFVGLYLAEGNTNKNGIAVSLNVEEKELQEKAKAVARRLGVGFTESIHPGTKSYQLIINSKRLMTHFLYFGKTSHSKRIPQEYMFLDNELTKEIIDGLCAGDGFKKNSREIMTLTTVSKELAYQTGFLLNRIGFNSNIRADKNVAYHVSYSLAKKLTRRYKDKNHTYVEVVNVWNYKDNLDVYNLSVEDSNTYTANGLIVHNCSGHNHLLGVAHRIIHVVDRTYSRVEQLRQMLVDCGGFLEWNGSYAESKQLPPLKIGSPRINLFIKRKTIRDEVGKRNDEITKDIHVSI